MNREAARHPSPRSWLLILVLAGAALLPGCDAGPGAGTAPARSPDAPTGAPAADAPRPSSPFSKAMARYADELYIASRAEPPGAALAARAKAEGWVDAPPELRSVHRTETAWLVPLEGREVIVATDAARGLVIVAALQGFDAAAAKRELETTFELEPLNRLNSPSAMLSQYFLRRDGKDHALVALELGTEGAGRGVGLIGFLPPEVARREMDARPAPAAGAS